MAKEHREKQPFKKAWKIEIQGDNLAILDPIITQVVAENNFKDCDFDARSTDSRRTDSFALFDVFIIDQRSKIPIGAITARLLGSRRIIVEAPPDSRFAWGHLSALEKIKMAQNESKYDEHFSYFIKKLEDKLPPYGVEVTRAKGVRQWIKSHRPLSIIITIIMFIAAVITILEFFGISRIF